MKCESDRRNKRSELLTSGAVTLTLIITVQRKPFYFYRKRRCLKYKKPFPLSRQATIDFGEDFSSLKVRLFGRTERISARITSDRTPSEDVVSEPSNKMAENSRKRGSEKRRVTRRRREKLCAANIVEYHRGERKYPSRVDF